MVLFRSPPDGTSQEDVVSGVQDAHVVPDVIGQDFDDTKVAIVGCPHKGGPVISFLEKESAYIIFLVVMKETLRQYLLIQ